MRDGNCWFPSASNSLCFCTQNYCRKLCFINIKQQPRLVTSLFLLRTVKHVFHPRDISSCLQFIHVRAQYSLNARLWTPKNKNARLGNMRKETLNRESLCIDAVYDSTRNNFCFSPRSFWTKTQSKANQPIAKGMLVCLFISFKMIMFQNYFLFVVKYKISVWAQLKVAIIADLHSLWIQFLSSSLSLARLCLYCSSRSLHGNHENEIFAYMFRVY